jgi:hypothetical protein
MSRREYLALAVTIPLSWFFALLGRLGLYPWWPLLALLFPYIIAQLAGRRYLIYGVLANTVYWMWTYIYYRFVGFNYPEGYAYLFRPPFIEEDLTNLAVMLFCAICVCLPIHIASKNKARSPA